MSYIDRNLLPEERILFRTKKHIIVFFFPVILLFICIYATPYMSQNPILVKLVWAPWLVAGIFWAYVGLDYMTSEFAVTNKRVMMREGFFYRHANEMRLTTISQINIDQSLVGQLLNYGRITLNAFGAYDSFPMIANPNRFQKYVNEQLDILTR